MGMRSHSERTVLNSGEDELESCGHAWYYCVSRRWGDMFSIEYQKLLHARSMNNRGALLDSKECGCFFCIRLYSPEIITQWINDETARCAFCGVDAVIPESCEYELTESLLLAMKEYWF